MGEKRVHAGESSWDERFRDISIYNKKKAPDQMETKRKEKKSKMKDILRIEMLMQLFGSNYEHICIVIWSCVRLYPRVYERL